MHSISYIDRFCTFKTILNGNFFKTGCRDNLRGFCLNMEERKTFDSVDKVVEFPGKSYGAVQSAIIGYLVRENYLRQAAWSNENLIPMVEFETTKHWTKFHVKQPSNQNAVAVELVRCPACQDYAILKIHPGRWALDLSGIEKISG